MTQITRLHFLAVGRTPEQLNESPFTLGLEPQLEYFWAFSSIFLRIIENHREITYIASLIHSKYIEYVNNIRKLLCNAGAMLAQCFLGVYCSIIIWMKKMGVKSMFSLLSPGWIYLLRKCAAFLVKMTILLSFQGKKKEAKIKGIS